MLVERFIEKQKSRDFIRKLIQKQGDEEFLGSLIVNIISRFQLVRTVPSSQD